ncbi:MAG: SUMF1/EgtB/PvdO family nonheme iron enzyme, partial [Planctomyces sp.]
HVLRGGSWASGPVHLRCSSRDYYGPGHRSYAVGFRVVADLTQAEKV